MTWVAKINSWAYFASPLPLTRASRVQPRALRASVIATITRGKSQIHGKKEPKEHCLPPRQEPAHASVVLPTIGIEPMTLSLLVTRSTTEPSGPLVDFAVRNGFDVSHYGPLGRSCQCIMGRGMRWNACTRRSRDGSLGVGKDVKSAEALMQRLEREGKSWSSI
ncbi:hypothetical protein BR93DRAFT_605812 [Coniochaeta sp. PMI_546]|nr:hypothetical protein BR93DRAFT_605812 [Coniochaeta sp. PMI_546]